MRHEPLLARTRIRTRTTATGVPDFLIRAADPADLGDFYELAVLAGAGFTSLPANEGLLAERLGRSQPAFAGEPGALILALEDVSAGRMVGCAAIKTGPGLRADFLNFLMSDDGRQLSPTPLYADLTEVGSLLVHPDYRRYGVGRWLAMSRYLVIASDLHRFGDHVFSELRGVIDENKHSPFYDGVLAPFLDLTYEEADYLSAHGGQADLNAMLPKRPIALDGIGDAARAAIARPHQAGQKALQFLEEEGFRFEGAVDLLDGGPLVVAASRSIGTIRSSLLARVWPGDVDQGGEMAILSAGRGIDFRCCRASVLPEGDVIICDSAVLEKLRIGPGDAVRLCFLPKDSRSDGSTMPLPR